MVIFHSYVNVYQRVPRFLKAHPGDPAVHATWHIWAQQPSVATWRYRLEAPQGTHWQVRATMACGEPWLILATINLAFGDGNHTTHDNNGFIWFYDILWAWFIIGFTMVYHFRDL